MTDESGYRAPAPRPVCARCGETAVAAQAARAPRPLPWNDAKIAFAVGAGLLVGAPVAIVGVWQGWLNAGVACVAYSVGMPLVAVTTMRALAARRAPAPPGPPTPPRAPQADAASTGLAVAGAGMATAGCGVVTLVLGALTLVGLAIAVVVALYVLKYFLGFSSIRWP